MEYELIVIDNASSDGSAAAVRAQFPQARVIANQDNGGYAKACNQAVEIGRGRHVLFLNSDTVMRACTLSRMVACLDMQPDIGAVSCLQCDKSGQVLQSCFPFPSVRDHLRYSPWVPTIIQCAIGGDVELDFTVSQDVEWANGACLMVRKGLFERMGGFDSRFFMYFEDVDLCRRIHQRGYRVWHAADCEVVHLIGRSSVESSRSTQCAVGAQPDSLCRETFLVARTAHHESMDWRGSTRKIVQGCLLRSFRSLSADGEVEGDVMARMGWTTAL